MKHLWIIFLILVLGCNSQESPETSSNESMTEVEKKEPPVVEVRNFDIVKMDSLQSNLQRIFVVIDSVELDRVSDFVCEIKEQLYLAERTNISFFSEEKYAGYYDELFDLQNDEDVETYKKWRDSYYLAEFENETGVLVVYPTNPEKKGQEKVNCKS